MATTEIPQLDMSEAHAAASEARTALADIERRADAGDPKVKPGELTTAQENVYLAERRVAAAQRQAEAEQAAAAEKARADAVARLADDFEVGRRKISDALEVALDAVKQVVADGAALNASLSSAHTQLSALGAPEGVTLHSLHDESIAEVAGRPIRLVPLRQALLALAIEALGPALADPAVTGAERDALVRLAAWPPGASADQGRFGIRWPRGGALGPFRNH